MLHVSPFSEYLVFFRVIVPPLLLFGLSVLLKDGVGAFLVCAVPVVRAQGADLFEMASDDWVSLGAMCVGVAVLLFLYVGWWPLVAMCVCHCHVTRWWRMLVSLMALYYLCCMVIVANLLSNSFLFWEADLQSGLWLILFAVWNLTFWRFARRQASQGQALRQLQMEQAG